MQIEEQVLPQRYQRFITHDINRILRELAGSNDKKDNVSLHAPSSPPVLQSGSQGAVTPLTLDTSLSSPQTPGATGLSRKNSNSDYSSEVELPFKGTC